MLCCTSTHAHKVIILQTEWEQSKSAILHLSFISPSWMFHWEGKGPLKQVSPSCTWLSGHCLWLQPKQAFNFHLTYRAQGENETRASLHFRSTRKLECLASRNIQRALSLNSMWGQPISVFSPLWAFFCALIINIHTGTFGVFLEAGMWMCVWEIQIQREMREIQSRLDLESLCFLVSQILQNDSFVYMHKPAQFKSQVVCSVIENKCLFLVL